jgi:hypothetical protein
MNKSLLTCPKPPPISSNLDDNTLNTNHFVLLTIAGQDYAFLGMDFCPSPDEIGGAYGVFSAY